MGDIPLIPMTYASLLEAYGWERFDYDARAAGATGFILADVPAGVRPEFLRVQLVAPTSTDQRIALAAAETDGWLYLVTVAGTTGASGNSSRRLWPPLPPAPGPSPTSRCTPGSGSRRRNRRLQPPRSATGSWWVPQLSPPLRKARKPFSIWLPH